MKAQKWFAYYNLNFKDIISFSILCFDKTTVNIILAR